MRLLFDENMPQALRHDLTGHDCNHVRRLGWRGIENGDLLTKAETAGFDVLITLDKGIPSEQTMLGRRIAVFVLLPAGQGSKNIRLFAGEILVALASVSEGEVKVFSHRNRT